MKARKPENWGLRKQMITRRKLIWLAETLRIKGTKYLRKQIKSTNRKIEWISVWEYRPLQFPTTWWQETRIISAGKNWTRKVTDSGTSAQKMEGKTSYWKQKICELHSEWWNPPQGHLPIHTETQAQLTPTWTTTPKDLQSHISALPKEPSVDVTPHIRSITHIISTDFHICLPQNWD